MKLYFEGTTNSEEYNINVAKFKTSDGDIVTVDRESTEYKIEQGKIYSVWHCIYLWHSEQIGFIDTSDPINEDNNLEKVLDGAEFVGYEYDDEAEEDYEVTCDYWEIM